MKKKLFTVLAVIAASAAFLLGGCKEIGLGAMIPLMCSHEYETVTVEATCQTEGYVADRCKKCEDEKNIREKKPKTAHTGVGECPTCDLVYLDEWITQLKTRAQHDVSQGIYYDGTVFLDGEMRYQRQITYVEGGALTLQMSDAGEGATEAVSLVFENGNGSYAFTYRGVYGTMEGVITAEQLTASGDGIAVSLSTVHAESVGVAKQSVARLIKVGLSFEYRSYLQTTELTWGRIGFTQLFA